MSDSIVSGAASGNRPNSQLDHDQRFNTENVMTKILTAKQQYWSQQLEQADNFDGSLADYAHDRGLSAQTLYRWRNVLRKRETTQVPPKTVFTEVSQPTFARPSLTLRLGSAQLMFSALPEARWLANFLL